MVVRCLQAKFVHPLLSHDPDSRPSADEILQHKLVIDFEETSRAYQKLRTHSRDRTVSSSSGNSVGGDGPSPRTVDCVSWWLLCLHIVVNWTIHPIGRLQLPPAINILHHLLTVSYSPQTAASSVLLPFNKLGSESKVTWIYIALSRCTVVKV